MSITRRNLIAGAAAVAAMLPGLAEVVRAQTPEKKSIELGVGGKGLLYYLPLTIAERRGYFKDVGLDVRITDHGGGAKALQSLIGGTVDVVTGAYEHTIRMQAKGQDVRAVVELGRFPAIVVAARKSLAGEIKSAAGLKGRKIGVTAPGSSTHLLAQFAMVKAGLKPGDASFIGVGSGASGIAAMKKGEIDAISHLDPVIAKLEADGDIVPVIDTRTEAGTRALFGGSNPAAVLYTKGEFIAKNPNTMQLLANAFHKALSWLETATPDDIADAVPVEYHLNDRPLYLRAIASSKESWSRTGVVPKEGMESVYAMLKTLEPEMEGAKVDLATTFDGRFIAKAK
jgi:NitT/TauT family transport system substrate-binding protein